MASAIRISEPAHAGAIEELVAADRVEIVPLDDEQLSSAWLELASLEGVFCEPASAADELRSRLGDRTQVLRLEIASAGASARESDG